MNKLSFLFISIIAVTLLSCSNDDVSGNQEAGLKLEFNTVTSSINDRSVTSKSNISTIAFHSGFITLREVELEAESDNDLMSFEFELEQTVVIDFATGATTPDISFISIPAGIYEEVEISLRLEDETDAPAIVLYGIYTDLNGTDHPVLFEFSTNNQQTFEVEHEGTVVFDQDETAVAQVTFNPALWFMGVSDQAMMNAALNEDNVIVISETQNTEIYEIVVEGLELASEVEFEN